MSFCESHYAKVETFLTCALCKRRLAKNHTYQIGNWENDELNSYLKEHKVPCALTAGTYLCKLCRYFTQLLYKYVSLDRMSVNHKSFFKSYRTR